MSKRSIRENGQVKSKYFTIDSYFKNSSVDSAINKRLKTSSENDQYTQQVEEAIKLSITESETNVESKAILENRSTEVQCPLCQTMIQTEFLSLEVHVNQCLDGKEEIQGEGGKEESRNEYKDNNDLSEQQNEDEDSYFMGNDDEILGEVLSFEQNSLESEGKENKSASSFSSLKQRFSFTGYGISPSTSQSDKTIDEPSKPSVSPSSWKDAFSLTSNQLLPAMNEKDVNRLKSIALPTANIKKKQKPCPFYKRVKDTRFTVDAFNYGKIPDCDGYFLSHFHSDHYGGLRSNWQEGPIYCSKITANLVKQELRVDSRYVHPLPMNELYPIPNSNVTVGLIDANHCPGSVLFLFIVQRMDGTKIRHLHTGDFRASPRMCLHPFLRQPENPAISCLYLDTTYLSPEYAFPAQEECIQAVCEAAENDLKAFHTSEEKKKPSIFDKWLRPKQTPEQKSNSCDLVTNNAFSLLMNSTSKKPRVLIVVGTYTIGKERVFINIARRLKCKVYAPTKKKRILLCQEDEELKDMLTNNPIEAQVHVVPLRDIRADIMMRYLEEHKPHFDKLIAFKPTGWTFKSSKAQTSEMKLGPLSHITIPPADRSLHLSPFYKHEKIKLYGVPYSEHSSFRELASFIASLNINKIIPTVNISQAASMSAFFDTWEEEKRSKRIEIIPYPNEDYW